ncbi:Uncharacterized protein Adt_06812 [Abeliophyllum distichum]|uniref:Uncharacterized protein n=1 Tax=Abeliophyllum distichum TaxID=126358 RepID=A0ABD1V7Z1_9LAMI
MFGFNRTLLLVYWSSTKIVNRDGTNGVELLLMWFGKRFTENLEDNFARLGFFKGRATWVNGVNMVTNIKKMAHEFFSFKRLGNLLIVEGKFCFVTNDLVLQSETVMKNEAAQNTIGGRIRDVGMGGIGNITFLLLYFKGARVEAGMLHFLRCSAIRTW